MLGQYWTMVTGAWRRNRRNILILSVASLASTTIYAYLKFKPLYDRIRSELAMLERMTSEMSKDTARDQQALVNRLNQNLVIADLTLRQWMVNMRQALIERFDVEGVRASIKRGSSSQEDMDKWNQFKVQGFARTLSALYISCILNALLKVQLAIVARYVHAESASGSDKVASSNTSPAVLSAPSPLRSLVTEECNRSFVAFAAHAQDRGLCEIEESALTSVQSELDKWQLGALCSFEDIKGALNNIRNTIESTCRQATRDVDVDIKLTSSSSPFRTIMFPSYTDIERTLESQRSVISDVCGRAVSASPSQGGVSGVGRAALTDRAVNRIDAMMAEACDVIVTQTFHQALESSLDDAFNALLDTVQNAFASTSTSVDSSVNQSVPFAAVMVRIMKAFDTLVPPKADDDSLLFHSLSQNERVRELAATIFLPLDERGLNVAQLANGSFIDSSHIQSLSAAVRHEPIIEELADDDTLQ